MTDHIDIATQLIEADTRLKEAKSLKDKLTAQLIEATGNDVFEIDTPAGRVVRCAADKDQWDSDILHSFIIANNPDISPLPHWVKVTLKPINKEFAKLPDQEQQLYTNALTKKLGHQVKISTHTKENM